VTNTEEIKKEVLATRKELPSLFDKMGLKIGAEIGVYKGEYSRIMLAGSKIERLYSVDMWKVSDGTFAESIHAECKKRLGEFGSRNEIVISNSVEASKKFADGSLDFVYIDADHTYDGCMADIVAWYPKVRSGGLVAGHDYLDKGNTVHREYIGAGGKHGKCKVKSAIDDYVARLPTAVTIHTVNERHPSFWFIKPTI
jgi:predicted O-methyltransferase YrrM